MNLMKRFATKQAIILLIGFFLLLSGLFFFYFYYLENAGFFPFCIIHQLTGLYCPGCGSTRATYWLFHGNVVKALKFNALYVVSLPLIAIFGLNSLIKGFLGRELFKMPVFSKTFLWIIVILVLIFGILRNIPLKPFNLLAP